MAMASGAQFSILGASGAQTIDCDRDAKPLAAEVQPKVNQSTEPQLAG